MKSRLSEVRRARPLLGTFVEITVDGLNASDAGHAIDEAFRVIEEVQCRMSFHDPGSTLSFLNRNAGHLAVPVDHWTFHVLECAAELHALSGGVFDVTVAPQLQTLGFLPVAGSGGGAPVSRDMSFADVELLPDRRVRFRNPNVKIDLGGIAKGFAVDQAIAALQNIGVPRGLVNAGGDLRAFGPEGFPVFIRHPDDPGSALLSFRLTNAALATSGHYFADRIVAGAKRGPIVNVRRGQLAHIVTSATVRASRATQADALTKVVMIRGEESLPVLNYFRADAIFVGRGGKTRCSSDWHETLDLPS